MSWWRRRRPAEPELAKLTGCGQVVVLESPRWPGGDRFVVTGWSLNDLGEMHLDLQAEQPYIAAHTAVTW